MNKRLRPYLEVMPIVFLLLFILIMGIFGALIQSFGYFPIIGLKEFTVKYYIQVFKSEIFLNSLIYTVYTTLISSVLSVCMGVIIARILFKTKMKIEFFYKIPIIIPHITVVLFAITFLSDTGIFSRIAYLIGIENSQQIFSKVLFNKNGLGVILSYVWKQTPYVMLSILTVLKRMNSSYEDVAVNLGASRFYTFRKVTLPMLLPTILSTFTIIFAFSFGAYEIPMLLGATKPRALPVQAFIEYQNPNLLNRPYAMAMNIVIIIFCVGSVMLFNSIIRRLVEK
ncbi:putative spermidine/putrescine transport system permease protein [Peptoniphilus asaccharolyticus DSM 20463]|uniref:Putative spermidine/putrescine transport system permease protein n=1 Tax=Peptoniphilus asaccharolyticus DSM 20463 TaxID=573058 RepID=A0A1W1VLK2_PEPAS|nr:ABC transporter permease subunit [Peptoniphilus asaccharolyticus]MBL7574510.1 ABC transporter permease subunit [Peptoniphilus asaccharolyticus]SMB94196.1 putative spermidine/putrescine transport system permease protein [Peptoniphilus asaccharolyticus DSM 20463]